MQHTLTVIFAGSFHAAMIAIAMIAVVAFAILEIAVKLPLELAAAWDGEMPTAIISRAVVRKVARE